MSENLPRIYYLSDNKPELLPEWAYFFMRVGYQLTTISNDSYRVVIGLAVPTRLFACSLAAIGIVFAKAGTENSVDDAQLQYILNLEPGTPVHVRKDNNRKLRGVIDKFEEYDGKPYIFIRTTKSLKCGFPLNDYAKNNGLKPGCKFAQIPSKWIFNRSPQPISPVLSWKEVGAKAHPRQFI